jgi:hypothetical protein
MRKSGCLGRVTYFRFKGQNTLFVTNDRTIHNTEFVNSTSKRQYQITTHSLCYGSTMGYMGTILMKCNNISLRGANFLLITWRLVRLINDYLRSRGKRI